MKLIFNFYHTIIQQNQITDWKDAINEVICGDSLDLMKKMPDNSVDLILTDPPYFRIKGNFDFVWKTFDDFLLWLEIHAKEWQRILKNNGSLYVFGHAKNIAYKQIILDKYFKLQNSLVWEKTDAQTKKGITRFRSFAPITERILFYSHFCDARDWEIEKISGKKVDLQLRVIYPIRDYLVSELKKFAESKNLNLEDAEKEISKICETDRMAYHYFGKYQWCLPTKEKYLKMQSTGFLRKEYEDLRKEYEDLRRPWQNPKKLVDVLRYAQESSETGKYKHPTGKPPKLIKDLILCSSRTNDLVFDGFMGSFTTARAAKDLGRRWIGAEINEEYCHTGEKRLQQEVLDLF